MEADGACHEQVVVAACDCAVSAVWLSFVGEVFVEHGEVAFGVEVVADGGDERCDDHWLCGGVGVEPIFAWNPLPDFVC